MLFRSRAGQRTNTGRHAFAFGFGVTRCHACQSAYQKHEAVEPVEKVFSETEIVKVLPASYRAKASKLLKNLKKDDRFSWNDTGEVKIDGKALQNSNILDLLSYAVKKPIRLDVPPPVGRVELLKFMRESETPKQLVGNTDFRDALASAPPPTKREAAAWTVPFSPPVTRSHARKKWLSMSFV